MKVEKIAFEDVRYNPELEGFEASVKVREGFLSFIYPVTVRAPLNAEFETITRSLKVKALSLHKTENVALRSLRQQVQQISALAA
ncbi:MAG: hypothetical protein AAGF53_18040 [Pseudomonadota bacterium]